MKKLNIGLIQQHNTADIADNIKRLTEGCRELASKGAQLIVLQELHNSLYFCQEENVDTFDLAEPIPGPSTELFGQLAKELNVVIVTSLFERRAAGLYHNTAVVIERDGSIAGKYRKMHIPDDPAYYEKFYFTPGDLGFKPIDTSVGRLGVLVCWDQWYPEAARLMALKGAEILIYPTAIGYADNDTPDEQQRQRRAWQTVQRGHAVANGLPVVAVNRVGVEGKNDLRRVDEQKQIIKNEEGIKHSESSILQQEERINFWGTSFVAGPQGELLHESPDDAEERTVVTIDMERCEQVRRWWPFLRDRRIDEYKEITKRFID
ncbi:MAG: carbon-nitrogen hydrolase [Prevotella sp.]|nr:carbon-nitrogen hydrolase [Prevotella sp.]